MVPGAALPRLVFREALFAAGLARRTENVENFIDSKAEEGNDQKREKHEVKIGEVNVHSFAAECVAVSERRGAQRRLR